MKGYPKSMDALIREFSKLPGIGRKTAERLAFFILKSHNDEVKNMADALLHVKHSIRFCRECNNLSDTDICEICASDQRDKSIVCVVEKPNDVISVEKMGSYSGVYHVLLGALSPLDGIGPKDIKLAELSDKVKNKNIKEVIIATDSNTEGEVTALYIARILKSTGVKITRIASGMPVGASLEYADQATLLRAFEGRVVF